MSLLPSTTEILFAIGAGDDVVGVTFECDHPREARERRIVSTSALPEGLDSAEIDAFVAAAMHAGEDLYHLDEGALSGLDADLVVTQDLCAVCAVDVSVVDDALAHLGCTAEVLTIDPHDLAEVLDSIARARVRPPATRRRRSDWSPACEPRLDTVRDAGRGASPAERRRGCCCSSGPTRPSRRATGCRRWSRSRAAYPRSVSAGEKSVRVTWDQALAVEPDVVVCAPCGYDLRRFDGAGARRWSPQGCCRSTSRCGPWTPTHPSLAPAPGWWTGWRRWPRSLPSCPSSRLGRSRELRSGSAEVRG